MKTKVYVNTENYDDRWLVSTGELPAIVPFLSEEQQSKYLGRDDTPDHRNPVLQEAIDRGKEYLDRTSLDDCDVVLLPFKYGMGNHTKYVDEAKQAGKKTLVIFNDDSSAPLDVGDECIVLRTSFYKSKKENHEYAMPTFSADLFDGSILEKDMVPSVSFCGGITHPLRLNTLQILHDNSDINCNFILRNGFWAPGVSKDVAIREFNENIRNSLYGFCCRGAGNFSYRFGEVLSHGRIPVLVDTDCVLPFDHKINWNDHALIVHENDVGEIANILIDFHKSKSPSEITKIQEENRKVWREYLTPLGFVKHIGEFIGGNKYAL